MHLALDIDDTVTAAPAMFSSMARAVKAGGGTVTILHGVKAPTVGQSDRDQAQNTLTGSGFTGPVDRLVCVPKPIALNKAMWAKQNGVDLLIDDEKKNVAKTAKVGVPAARFKQ